jgi:hypothetical protein
MTFRTRHLSWHIRSWASAFPMQGWPLRVGGTPSSTVGAEDTGCVNRRGLTGRRAPVWCEPWFSDVRPTAAGWLAGRCVFHALEIGVAKLQCPITSRIIAQLVYSTTSTGFLFGSTCSPRALVPTFHCGRWRSTALWCTVPLHGTGCIHIVQMQGGSCGQ